MPATTTPNGVLMSYDTFGSPDHPAMVLIQGLGAHMLGSHDDLRQLAARGHHVIRFDNRDVGLSQKFPVSGYTLADMAGDTAGLLDALHIDEAHIVGQSMGGVIAQHLTLNHPNSVRSLPLVYSTPNTDFIQVSTCSPDGSRPTRRQPRRSHRHSKNEAVSASPRYPRDLGWIRELGGLMYDRCYDLDGVRRQTEALQNPKTSPRCYLDQHPTTIIHGSDDQLIAPAASRRCTPSSATPR